MVHAVDNDLPHGLTEDERESLGRFKKLLAGTPNGGLYQDLSQCDLRDGCDDDITILRFLRGRSFDVEGAFKQFQEASKIREAVNAIGTYNIIDVDDFEQTRNIYPHWIGRRDNFGRPICFFDLKHLDHAALSRYATSKSKTGDVGGPEHATDGTQQAIAFHDYLTRFVMPLCTAAAAAGDRSTPSMPVMSAVYLVDINSFSLRQAWSLKSYAQDVSQLLATCYPETIERVYVLNASPYFGKIWNFLSKWIDPRTASKLVIVPQADVLPTLSSTIGMDDIPAQFGGKFQFEHGMTPCLDEGIAETVNWVDVDVLPTGPLKWMVNENNAKVMIATGTERGHPRRLQIASII